MKTTKCDGCHKKRVLRFFRNKVDSGYVAYCRKCAIKTGYYDDSKVLHGSAISNANVLADVIKGKADEDWLRKRSIFEIDITVSHTQNNSFVSLNNPIERELANKPHCSRYDNISNAKQHSSHADQTTTDRTFTNEGRNEEMRGMTAPAL